MEQQTEQGIVLEYKGAKLAKVRVPRTSECTFCENAQGCCEPFGDDHMIIEAINDADAQVGQSVHLEFVSEGLGKAMTILYIIPLISLIIGVVVGNNLQLFGSADASAALLGFIFLILSFAGIYGYNRMTRSKNAKYQPRIVRVVPPSRTTRQSDASFQKGGPSKGKSCPHCH